MKSLFGLSNLKSLDLCHNEPDQSRSNLLPVGHYQAKTLQLSTCAGKTLETSPEMTSDIFSYTHEIGGSGMRDNATNFLKSSQCKDDRVPLAHSGHSLQKIQDLIASNSATYLSRDSEKPLNDCIDIRTTSVSEDTDKFDDEDRNGLSKKRKQDTYSTRGGRSKRCGCIRLHCLRLFCGCFAAGEYCTDICECHGCFNKLQYEDIVHATWEKGGGNQCNCKKSKCMKLHCECYKAKVGCSGQCWCDGCRNSFGTKPETRLTEGIRHQASGRDLHDLGFSSAAHDRLKSDTNAILEVHGKRLNPCNPLAFTPKGGGNQCSCQKLKCMEWRCKCYKAKVGCSGQCRCDGCQNSFGTKPEIRFTKRIRHQASGKDLDDLSFSSAAHDRLKSDTNAILEIGGPLMSCCNLDRDQLTLK